MNDAHPSRDSHPSSGPAGFHGAHVAEGSGPDFIYADPTDGRHSRHPEVE